MMRRVRHRSVRSVTVGAAAAALVVVPAGTGLAQDEDASNPGVVQGQRWLLNDELAGGSADHDFFYGPRAGTKVMGDWNGDGERTPGVVTVDGDFTEGDGPFTLVWYLKNSRSGGPADIVVHYGEARNPEDLDTPVVGDWNGDGVDTIGVVRPDYQDNSHQWLLRNENSGGTAEVDFRYGTPNDYGRQEPEGSRDVPVVGDWNDDGTTTAGVVRQDPDAGTSRWLLHDENAGGAADHASYFGRPGDRPLTGDWDGEGAETPGVVRDGRWLLRDDHTGGGADHDFHYGELADVPVTWR